MRNEQLQEYIRTLSLHDKKTLSQKTLKLFEEGGELAKAVLPFEGGYATQHRITDRNKILEECADCMLVIESIIHSTNFTMEELENMKFTKAQVWDALQRKEDSALEHGDKFPFEIHITVNGINSVDSFKAICSELQVKPIILDLQSVDGNHIMDDFMTSSKFYGNNGEAIEEMERIASGLSDAGFNVIRKKIESSYWHPKAPFKKHGDTEMPKGCYFEAHLNIVSNDSKQEKLAAIASLHDCHLSRNIFKRLDAENYTIMITLRSYEMMYEDFEASLESLKNTLFIEGFEMEKEIAEFSIYDTKIAHDAEWLKG